MTHEPSRQIHLDFHTSELIPGIGADFSKAQFQEALKTGHVNLINVFAKGHHGWSYYPTKIGIPHPNLQIDLLGQQIEACHEIGVAAPIYFTMGWSANDAETHPEWCVRTESGEIAATSWDADARPDTPKPGYQWKHLCPSGEYHELIRSQTDEICRTYPVDGFWYDIYQAHVYCYCERCREGMKKAGLDAAILKDAAWYKALTIQRHCEDLVSLITGHHPEASIYFNGLTSLGLPENLEYKLYQWNTKNDLEDLPTTWGGYDKFPLRAKLFHKEHKPIVAMSGKFHTSWGEFGGFKSPEAIRFEAASMIAFGSRCNIGDQLHPAGAMDMATYRNIGHAYEYVEKIEHLGIGGLPVANLGLWMGNDLPADEGTVRMLMEEQIDFDVIRPGDDLVGFETIVVPSVAGILDGDAPRVQKYIADGGSVLILGEGLLTGSRDAVALDAGVSYVGAAEYDMDFTVAGESISSGLPESPFLNYQAAFRVEVADGSEVLATVREPYFSRTYGSYCGHLNTPYKLENAHHPAVVRRGKVIVCAHALDRIYYDLGAKAHRDLFTNLIKLLHTQPMVEAGLPSAGRVSLLHFPEQRRYVLHLLYAAPLQRGRCLIIEDMPVLREVPVRLRLPEAAREITLEPAGFRLESKNSTEGGMNVLELTVGEFRCHTAICVTY
jgi:hypothetical protein